MGLEPLAGSKVLTEQVYERLVAAIADGTLRPGQRVRQDEVAALLGVSRQPVSHALQLVRRQGLVVEHGRKGLAVAPIEPARVRDLYRVRGALDDAVREAYRMPKAQAPLEFLLELNEQVAAAETSGEPVVGPGLPPTVNDPKRYVTDDCTRMA